MSQTLKKVQDAPAPAVSREEDLKQLTRQYVGMLAMGRSAQTMMRITSGTARELAEQARFLAEAVLDIEQRTER